MKATSNKVVSFHYTLKDKETGEVLDSSQVHGQPLTVLFGANNIIPGLESRMEGMEVGETRTIEVPAAEAYGEKDPNLIQQAPREYFQGVELEKGLPLQAQTPEGQIINMIVVDFDENTVTVDLNHPLAGKDLIFKVEVTDVRDASLEEIKHGHAHGEGGHHH
ncbi:MAG TPA: peptidylprolyl isomerase [Persephonella sp.]|uniref:Peptidyl-prolyl cis-trans isomerase n=1 Tax=Persephonella marina (strain DSM 14350 / EX-H1) TaxID=123214 RepID=C0QTX3_PERMH|nr:MULTISPECIES: peptidylprolyl isomerase [Persephonella]ACO03534.1 peptidyl-prolyl cis-trans isomerase, fkbp-type [Persephonella marina EX-H1]HCB70245.1 peptidylprolyl isomerase [Persephonella sp.]